MYGKARRKAGKTTLIAIGRKYDFVDNMQKCEIPHIVNRQVNKGYIFIQGGCIKISIKSILPPQG